MIKKTFHIQGMTCAACVSRIERALAAMEGVQKVSVNLASHRGTITYDEKKIDFPAIREMVRKTGYEAVETAPGSRGQSGKP